MNPGDRILNSTGFVIKQSDYGEADRLLTIFSQKKGKVKAFVRGVRKARSRKAGHLQTLSLVHLMLARGKTFWVVSQVDTVNTYPEIKADLKRTAQALYILELIDRFAPEEEPSQLLFQLTAKTLERIEQLDKFFFAVKYFELKLLQIIGYRPNLTNCVQCGKEVKAEDQYFSARHGGVKCPDCGIRDENVIQISVGALKYLRHTQRSTFQDLQKINADQQISEEVDRVILYYLTYLGEKRLNTPLFINQLVSENESESKP